MYQQFSTSIKKKVALALGGAMFWRLRTQCRAVPAADSLFGWLVADGWCWFVLREEYC
jgi:hypothetical protein